MSKGFFITCAIDYPNARLHMGHIYEKTIADVIARVHRLNGEKVLFTVGSDEHGEKVAEIAAKEGLSTQEYVTKMSDGFQKLMDSSGISYDRFVRTTDKDHIHAAQTFFQKMWDADDIYPDMYEGWYCISDETFWLEKDLVEGKCPNAWCHKPVKRVKEESYFFKWSAYQEKLEKWYADVPENVFPDFRKKEMENFMKNGLRDVSFSRKSIKWGIPTPMNKEHTIYVWSDALVNYLTVCGYPDKKYADFWPADIHVIGMDINRFHSLLWPAMLMSARIPLPKQILVHGFINDANGTKMSKSLGNVIDPLEIISKYGVESLRYYLLREAPLGNDLSFSEKNLMDRSNAELADSVGNLVFRVLSMLEKYTNGVIPASAHNSEVLAQTHALAQEAYAYYLAHDIQNALVVSMKIAALGNKFIADTQPWKLMKEGKREEVEMLLATEVEIIRVLATLLSPVLP
ncbi:MAG: methionine--tRNA ligase, partial [Candidatus Diapherotrites archaeon]|nr:methionine--tRNA ligase [Candidatus Diapherotrites archaeon]